MYNTTKKILYIILLLTLSVSVSADDIDALKSKSKNSKANILFILDNSASMNEPAGGGKTRMKIMQDALTTVLDTAPNNLNVGISHYGGIRQPRSYMTYVWEMYGKGTPNAHLFPYRFFDFDLPNGIKFPISPIDDLAKPIVKDSLFVNGVTKWELSNIPKPLATTTVRNYLSELANTWVPYGNTPIVDALYEAARYFRGEQITWGYDLSTHPASSHPATYVDQQEGVGPIVDISLDPESCDFWDERNVITGSALADSITCPADVNNPTAPAKHEYCEATKKNCYTPNKISPVEWLSYRICGRYDENGSCASWSTQTWDGVDDGIHTCNKWDDNNKCIGMIGGLTSKWKSIPGDTEQCRFFTCINTPKPAPNYISPIVDECTSNSIILLSDGKPEYKQGTSPSAKSSLKIQDMINNTCSDKPSGFASGECGPELTEFLATTDNAPGNTTPGDQFINTLVIGFSSGITSNAQSYLESLVTIPDDPDTNIREGYYSATSEAELTNAFSKAFQEIEKVNNNTYSTATYSAPSSISLTNGQYAYVPIFEISSGYSWSGNLKKYEVINDKLYGFNEIGNKVRATDSNGAFLENVNDLWSTSFAKNSVTSGGFANKINPNARNVLIDNSATTGLAALGILSSIESELGVTTTAKKEELINYMLGKKPDGTARHHMGDIIHGKPLELRTSTTDFSPTADGSILFIGTNEGYLHAINSNSGEEIFAYMPRELLKNIKPQFEGAAQSKHIYGIDGQITIWSSDYDQNGIKGPGENAHLFFGLRRGGQSYYALDIKQPLQPKFLWKIDPSTTGFEDLGFTWSTPKVEKLKYQKDSSSSITSRAMPVLIFGGGYHDDHAATNPPQIAKGVYIVNALNGELLAKFTHANNGSNSGDEIGMVPGDIRSIDINRDGSVDRLYFGDTNANVWRVDLNANKSAPYNLDDAKITKLANLGGSGVDNRSFFSDPDVAIFKHHGKYAISVSVGTGKRPTPMSTDVNDYFFMLLDENVYKVPPSYYSVITMDKLLNAPVTNIDLVDNLSKANSKKGWKLALNSQAGSSEKSLSAALTYQNKIMFTTFSAQQQSNPVINTPQSCTTSISNSSKLYVMDLLTGSAPLNLADPSNNTNKEISIEIGSVKIPETPQIRFGAYTTKNGGPCTSDDCVRQQAIHAADKAIALPPDISMPRINWINHDYKPRRSL